MVPFSSYAKVVNNICLVYSGILPEYAQALSSLLPYLRDKYPDLSISLCVPDQFLSIAPLAFPLSELPERQSNFAFLKKFLIDPNENVVLKFVQENGLSVPEEITSLCNGRL